MTIDATSTVRTEIDARLTRHADALARADVDAAVELYTPDAIVRPANLEPVRGHAALRQFFTRWFSAMTVSGGRYFTDELHVFDDYAFQLGNYEFTATPTGGSRRHDRAVCRAPGTLLPYRPLRAATGFRRARAGSPPSMAYFGG